MFGEEYVVDVEYSRVLAGAYPKLGLRPDGLEQIFPDLIVHRRTEDEGNILVVEIKLGDSAEPHARGPRPDRADLRKVTYLTGRPVGMSPYEWGLCLDLRPDAAFLHWVRDGGARPVETWTPSGAAQHAASGAQPRWRVPAAVGQGRGALPRSRSASCRSGDGDCGSGADGAGPAVAAASAPATGGCR